MRSRIFAVAMAALCAAAAYWCVSMGRRFWRAYQVRQTHERAIELFKQGQYEEALPLLDQSIARMPSETDLVRIAAYVCARTGRSEDFRRYSAALLDQVGGKEAATIHFNLGLMDLNGSGEHPRDLDAAIRHFEAALKDDGGLLDARAALGIAYALKGDAVRARPHLERVWAESSTRGPGQLTLTARLWEITDLLRRGEAIEAWLAYMDLYSATSAVAKDDYRVPIALTLAFRVNAPSVSSVLRRLCLGVAGRVPEKTRDQFAVQLHTLSAAAFDHLGEDDSALREYRLAYQLDPEKGATTRRNLAFALRMAAAQTPDKEKSAKLEEESLKLYRDLLAGGRLAPEEQRQLALALSTRAWNAGRTDEALQTLQSLGGSPALAAIRMRATEALRTHDYKTAIGLLHDAFKLDDSQQDVGALLQRLSLPPEIVNFRVNALNRYDSRPILSGAVVPRALPIPIAPDKLAMKLDGEVVQPIRTRGEVFYRPTKALDPGEHHVELAATDALGLKASKTLTFSIEPDKEPPRVVGLAPADKSTTETQEPILSFRCTDPSGIDERSLTVVFSGRVGKPPLYREGLALVDRGFYQLDLVRSGIKKGTRVLQGAVSLQFADPLGEGTCSVRVGVSDTRGNRAVKTWTFKIPAKATVKEPKEPK